ncbi:MAG: PQQ-binding-like beta-propeller repeat protein [Anaerolineales bacterium]|nr:PQQ-binding-like beta-propeller repeat protein [Anaerolineales bacterium]
MKLKWQVVLCVMLGMLLGDGCLSSLPIPVEPSNTYASPTASPSAEPQTTFVLTTNPSATPVATSASPVSPASSSEWSQHAHDAQHTGYTSQVVPYPWRVRWIWNGVDERGRVRKVTSSGSLPRNVQPVTGRGRVYIAAGVDGVFALDEATGEQVWQRAGLGDVRSTLAYDAHTQTVFALSANGRLYKLNAADGALLGEFNSGQSSDLPLPPALSGDRLFFSMGSAVFAVQTQTMELLWRYDAGAQVAVPPAYSPSRNLVVVATEPDLYVHAVDGSNGTLRWRIRPVHPDRKFEDPTEYRYGWPVIAENAGYVLIKVRLDWERIWQDWPQTNPEMRRFLTENPGDQALFVLDLDDGRIPFLANVGHGGYGDGGYIPMGPQPVVKRLETGQEVVYIVIRAKHAYDARWDSHFGEMMLDDRTVSGLQGGDVRFIAFDWPPGSSDPFLLTDEQPNISMAGDYLFGGHWEAGFALRLLDRSERYGSFDHKIPSERLATVVTSQDNAGACPFTPSHYCASGLENTRGYDFGFYIYYGQGAVYDRYWSEYAVWVISNDNLYFRSCDGAIIALTSGQPPASAGASWPVVHAAPSLVTGPVAVIPYTEARRWDGQMVTVWGTIQYVFNNGKYVLLGFAHPHQGAFKALILKSAWSNFSAAPETLYEVGQTVSVTGTISWYQGDPAIYVLEPGQIHRLTIP